MAVQKIDYSIDPSWTYDQLLVKYCEILQTLGVYGALVDTYVYNNFTIYVYKRTYQPSESPVAKYPNCYVETWIDTSGNCWRQCYYTADGSWNTDTHRFEPGSDPDEKAWATYYSLSSTNRYSSSYARTWWSFTANLNEKLPIYLYRSQADPNFWWVAIDNSGTGTAVYEPSSSTQLDPIVPIDQRYCFPSYRITGHSENSITIRHNGQSFSESWVQKGAGSSNINWINGYADRGDLDRHGFNSVTSEDITVATDDFSMPNLYGNGGYSSGDTRLTLVRGAKWTNWLKNKLIPNDFALLADPSTTSQTRVGQPYIINGKTYEVVKASHTTSHGMFLVAQITD